MSRKARRKSSGLRKFIRGMYKLLGMANTGTYILGAGANPGGLIKHVARRRTSKAGSRLIR
jgi:hypothetical protein